ncbi:glycosyltransferase family 1 protein [Candidatus Parcubacteria bacterium]|nr:MAG: glycosyltransferase family 1 protein [Candidatus Parcubacteria bacterium]
MSKSKIVIAAEIFPPDIGGPATYSKNLAEELNNRGFDAKIICYSDKIESDKSNFEIVRILRGGSRSARYFFYFWNLLKMSFRCDVIYAMGPVSSGLPSLLAAYILNKKVVVKVVGDYAWEQARNSGLTDMGIDEFQNQKLTGKILWLKRIESFVCRHSDKVIVPSRYLKKIVKGWKVQNDKIDIIYNSFSLSHPPFFSRQTARQELEFSDKDFLIVSMGRPVSWKGFGLLSMVVADLKRKEIPEIKLRILGVNAGDQIERLIRLYNDKAVFENHRTSDGKTARILRVDDYSVPFEDPALGTQTKEMAYKYLAAADIFVLNSGYEGLSHAILEALSLGIPVIASDVGGNPELITDGTDGLLIGYNNKDQLKQSILKLYGNKSLRQKLVGNSKEKLKRFSSENMIQKTTEVLLK